ncbi:hypothetical protein LTR53_006932 [Teratosphaeriaceae sp. CCFEE 6253]|nr:hypothetical protein LTR53_006932 [Teratosphaeriaceae sp. CCFEE 6253]
MGQCALLLARRDATAEAAADFDGVAGTTLSSERRSQHTTHREAMATKHILFSRRRVYHDKRHVLRIRLAPTGGHGPKRAKTAARRDPKQPLETDGQSLRCEWHYHLWYRFAR